MSTELEQERLRLNKEKWKRGSPRKRVCATARARKRNSKYWSKYLIGM